MFFKQYYLDCLAQASYFIGDPASRVAAVVDPQRDIDSYVEEARIRELQIRYVFLTHFHADFVAGHLELRNRTGAEICLGAKAHANYPFRAMTDGYEIEFGSVLLKILETPGHSTEGISIAVYDLDRTRDIPHAVLTGDTLFIGDVGRPDLMASIGLSAEDLAAQLYDSLHQKILLLPDETLVYPAHGAGSLCGGSLSMEHVSTLGEQRRYNHALQPMSKAEFIRRVTDHLPEAPKYFAYVASLNRREHALLDETLDQELHALSLDEVLGMKNQGAVLLDVRNSADFAGGHLSGSVNIGLGGKLASWAGTLLDVGDSIVIIAEPGREREVAVRLGRVGFDRIVGYLKGGMEALQSTPELVQRTARITAGALSAKLMTPEWPFILDVRTEEEWKARRIDSSVNIPLPHVLDRLSHIPSDRPVVVHCATGDRSSIAVSLLLREGWTNVTDLVGGFEAWEQEIINPSLHSAEAWLPTDIQPA